MQEFDVLVIGGGPGGYVAAIRAAKNGAKTALVERKEFGGTCLNIGCIPTKTLIAGVDVYHKARHAMEFGVKISGEVSPDWEAMLARKDSVIKTLRGGIGSLLKAAGVTVLTAKAGKSKRSPRTKSSLPAVPRHLFPDSFRKEKESLLLRNCFRFPRFRNLC